MAHSVMFACSLAVFTLVVVTQSLTLDEDATVSLRKAAATALNGGEVAILVKAHDKVSQLLHAKDAEDISITLNYNKNSDKVSLESLIGDHLKSVSWTLGEDRSSSLVLVMTATRVKLVVGCKQLRWHSMVGRHNLLNTLSSHKMKLYLEENVPVKIYNSERDALDSVCDQQDSIKPPFVTTVTESDYEEVGEFKKKHDEEMQGDEYRTNFVDPNAALPGPTPQRGDIPSNAIESCDDEVIRQLTLLRQTIEQLRREVGEQRGTIDSLRTQLQQCCHRVTPPTPPPPERCSGSSCYPGYY